MILYPDNLHHWIAAEVAAPTVATKRPAPDGIELLDKDFIDETRTKSFYESGKWDAKARKALLDKAYRKMKSDCLTPSNIDIAQNNADLQMRNVMKAMGYNNITIRFSDNSHNNKHN